uniref:Uncharacterized protein n=1 Tax=Tanacetum cinerariifolium TaxID=118510 RepID=A0A6L2NMM5_TANCI|nr:hypothetical protein [Tanacetum cinerariifolium]
MIYKDENDADIDCKMQVQGTISLTKHLGIVASIVLGDEMVFQVLKLSHRLKLEKLKGLNDLELRRAPIRVLAFPILKDVMMLEKLTTWMIAGIRDKSNNSSLACNDKQQPSSGEEIRYSKEEQLHILGYDQLRNNKGAISSKKLGARNCCCTLLAQPDWQPQQDEQSVIMPNCKKHR